MILNFTDPFFTTRVLGFEPLFDRLQRLSESSDKSTNYPPYNIRRDGNNITIEVAVAGLSKEDLIQEEQNEFLPAPLEHFRLEIHLGDRSITWEKIQMYLPSQHHVKSWLKIYVYAYLAPWGPGALKTLICC